MGGQPTAATADADGFRCVAATAAAVDCLGADVLPAGRDLAATNAAPSAR